MPLTLRTGPRAHPRHKKLTRPPQLQEFLSSQQQESINSSGQASEPQQHETQLVQAMAMINQLASRLGAPVGTGADGDESDLEAGSKRARRPRSTSFRLAGARQSHSGDLGQHQQQDNLYIHLEEDENEGAKWSQIRRCRRSLTTKNFQHDSTDNKRPPSRRNMRTTTRRRRLPIPPRHLKSFGALLLLSAVSYFLLVLATSTTQAHQQPIHQDQHSHPQAPQQQANTYTSDQLWFQQPAAAHYLHLPTAAAAAAAAAVAEPKAHLAEDRSLASDDSFGSRLVATGRQSDEPLARSESAAALNSQDQGDDGTNQDDANVFMRRQGLSSPGQSAGGANEQDQQSPGARRQARQPAPAQMRPPQPSLLMQQQSRARQALAGAAPSGFMVNQNLGQERFQRLRNFEPFPRPNQNGFVQNPSPSQNQNFVPAQQQQQNNNLQRQQLGLPTLSAFDLSSLANLASQQAPVQPQAQQGFRRVPQQQQQQVVSVAPPQSLRGQQQPNFPLSSQFFDGPSRQQPASPSANNQPTELPFIRQVFRPAAGPVPQAQPAAAVEETSESSQGGNSPATTEITSSVQQARPLSSGGRPTPPPLFVPSRQQVGSNHQQQASRARPLVESGFSPIQPARNEPIPSTAFFEPSPQRHQPQAQRQPIEAAAQQQQQQQQQQLQRKPTVRRPSQRPHVPLATGSQAQPPATRQQSVNANQQQPQAPATDVIRLASSAIQAANEGLASVLQSQPSDSSAAQSTPATSTSAAEPQQAAATTTPASQPQPQPQSQSQSQPQPQPQPLDLASTGRRAVSPQPPRTSANFFQTLTSAATSPPSSFSPALPINQAIAATGGRRRIPVRPGQQSVSSARSPQTTTPMATSTTTTAAPATSTTSGRFAASSASGSSPAGPVRRPEMEEFYETIGGTGATGGLGSLAAGSATTLIDGFGAPSRPKLAASSEAPQTTTTSNPPSSSGPSTDSTDGKQLTTTTDLYGSRLPLGQPADSSNASPQARPNAAQALLEATNQLQHVDRHQAAAAAASGAVLVGPQAQAPARVAPQAEQNTNQQQVNQVSPQQPVMVPVTYMTTLTYLTTVLHGTHTLETSHETVERSTKMATMNAQLISQIEHRLPLIEPTATVAVSSRVKGRGTTLVNLKSAVSAYNQELVEALGAAGGGQAAPVIQPTQVVSAQSSILPTQLAAGPAQASFNQRQQQQQQQQLKQQRPSRMVDLKELQELKRQLVTEYVYSYTMRARDQPDQQPLATSVRTELVSSSVEPRNKADLLLSVAQNGGLAGTLIDSNGLLRLGGGGGGGAANSNDEFGTSQINLGSTVGKDTPQMMTEVNMQVATYLKFDGISNVMVDVRPTARLPVGDGAAPMTTTSPGGLAPKSQLDTSFNVHMTLGNALEQLGQQQSASSQQTPALEPTAVTQLQQQQQQQHQQQQHQPTAIKMESDLLRSPAAGQHQEASDSSNQQSTAAAAAAAISQTAVSSAVARSQLRSRVASSRLRSQFQTLQPARAAAVSPSLVSSPAVPVSESAAPPVSGLRQRPNKSRISRPSLLQRSQSSPSPQQEGEAAAAAAATPNPVQVSSTRSSKPRFVVVTRTGQFGIRASAIGSLAAAAAPPSDSTAAQVEPTQTQASPPPPQAVPTVRVSSRFVKPNRFRGQSLHVPSRGLVEPATTTSVAAPAAASAATEATQAQAPATLQSNQQQDSQAAKPTGERAPQVANSQQAENSASPNQVVEPIKLEGSAAVVVTYFTTTTHTFPFELNSETVFTTIEETNSRVATEFMSDLSSHFIEPTPTAGLPTIAQTAPPTLPGFSGPVTTPLSDASATTEAGSPTTPAGPITTTTTTSNDGPGTGPSSSPGTEQPATTSTTAATTTTSNDQQAPLQQADNNNNNNKQPPIEPSFVTTFKTQTHFTTFTYFTTYSAGGDLQTVKSSESTTSNMVVQTLRSLVEPSASLQNKAALEITSSPLPPQLDQQRVSQSEGPVTKTLLSTMTYYGTVYNGTERSLTPILDVSTQVLTVGGPGASAPPALGYGNSEILANSSIGPAATEEPAQQPIAPTATEHMMAASVAHTPPLDDVSASPIDKITRTKSMYTTLTHFITFYSGTKTQLSTIQEISPTVVTEYIDRTLFERQQAEASASSSVSLVVPTAIPTGPGDQTQPSISLTTPQATTEPQPQPPATTTTTTTTTTSPQSSSTTNGEGQSSSADSGSSASTATTSETSTSSTVTSTGQPTELDSVSVSQPSQPSADNQQQQQQQQQQETKVLASSDQSVESKQATSYLELTDLLASNSSQSSRVLAGNLGAAIKDIVQLLAGNKTQQQQQQSAETRPAIGNLDSNLSQAPSSSTSSQEQPSSEQPSTTSQTTSSTSPPQSTQTSGSLKPARGPSTRVFGNKQRLHGELHGSISSPPTSSPTAFDDQVATTQSGSPARPTPELVQATGKPQMQNNAAAATIFFGDDSGDERRKQIKTVWPGVQSTIYVTSIEPSTRSLTVTTTKVYYTRDAPLTITSSFTSVIAPRTFVSTIMGTRTLVNQLNGPSTATATLPGGGAAPQPQPSQPSQPKAVPTRPADTQNAAVANRYKQQKQQQQVVAQEQRKQAQLQQALAKQQQLAKLKLEQQLQLQEQQKAQAQANINQCQPACKQSLNEICRFTPSESNGNGAQGSFACACRPGYYMALNSVGQRQCQEVQSYVIMLRLLQVGDQQVAYKRELQSRSSPEFKQLTRIVREHVKRAYMTSDLVRDRYAGSEILNFARTLSVSSSTASQSLGAQPSAGRQPLPLNSSQLDPLNAGLIVNMTIHLLAPNQSSSSNGGNMNEIQVDESLLKEELAKKLNMRQAAALAAAAAAAASPTPSEPSSATSSTPAGPQQQQQQQQNQQQADQPQLTPPTSAGSGNSTWDEQSEMLPNPNALFLADVEHVQDLDECASPTLNDCHEGAVCMNEPGSYRCDCRDYPDLNPLNPGRQCASELKSCDFCNNRGDCLRVPSLFSAPAPASNSTAASAQQQPGNGRGQSFSTVCQCHRIYLGRRCEINGLLLATLLPIAAILLIISVCLVIYCCRRWRRRSSMSKGFRNIGSFGPNIIGSTLDRKAMLESSSESSDTHQRNHQASHHLHHQQHLRQGGALAGGGPTGMGPSLSGNMGGALNGSGGGLFDSSEPGSSSQESSPRQMVRGDGAGQANAASSYLQHLSPSAAAAVSASGQSQANSLNPYCSSIPPQIVIPRARHNQVNYAVHRGQVYMW